MLDKYRLFTEQADAETKLNQARLQSIIEIFQYKAESIQSLLEFTLDEAIKLTDSTIGYLYHYDEEKKVFILNNWSKNVMNECKISQPETIYYLHKTGIWGEAVRQRKPLVVNDFQAAHPLKKGTPAGHAKLYNYMTIPVFSDEKIVAVVGVANKNSDYSQNDVLQLTLLMDAAWKKLEFKRAEDALRVSEQKLRVSEENYRLLADSTPDHIYSLDREFRYTAVNQGFCSALHMKTDQIIGRKPRDLDFPMELLQEWEELFHKVFTTGKVVETEFTTAMPDGRVRTYELILMPILAENGTTISIRGTNRDITDRKKMEKELMIADKLDSLGILAGGIAHDYNNILTVILGYVSLAKLQLEQESKTYRSQVEIEKAALQAKDLTRQLLTFSRGGEPQKETVCVEELLHDLVEFALPGSNISIETKFASPLPLITADPGQLNQVMNNLFINASQAMPQGGTICVDVATITLPKKDITEYGFNIHPGDYIRIAVKDEGMGIPEENLVKIFDPFFTTKDAGSGLGLPVCYSIIKNHAGHIRIHSKLGEGSIFYIYLPVGSEDLQKTDFKREKVYQGKGKILLMDDEKGVRNVAGDMLDTLGYEVVMVENGLEAIEAYEEALAINEPFRAVIMDLTIRGSLGGKETIKRLLKIDVGVKAIVSSGYSNDVVLTEYGEHGFAGVVAKPYKIEELSRVLHSILANKA